MKILGVETGEARRGRSGPSDLARLLERNAALRDAFADSPAARKRLAELQRWQSERLLRSHADLRANPRYRAAVEFFFSELYGGGDPRRVAIASPTSPTWSSSSSGPSWPAS